jgi:transcriptional regulator with XRE-family HTH domain
MSTPSPLANIGRAVRQRRLALGLTQTQLGRMSGLSRQVVCGLETGALAELGFNRVVAVLNILGLNLEFSPRRWNAPAP